MSEVATVEVVKAYARTPVGVDVHVAVALVVVISGKCTETVMQCPGTLLGVCVHLGLVFGVGNLVARLDLCRFGLRGVGFKSVDCCCGIDGGDLGRVGYGVAYGVGGGGDRGVCHGATGGIAGGRCSRLYGIGGRCRGNACGGIVPLCVRIGCFLRESEGGHHAADRQNSSKKGRHLRKAPKIGFKHVK